MQVSVSQVITVTPDSPLELDSLYDILLNNTPYEADDIVKGENGVVITLSYDTII